jgi:hypothetical protein
VSFAIDADTLRLMPFQGSHGESFKAEIVASQRSSFLFSIAPVVSFQAIKIEAITTLASFPVPACVAIRALPSHSAIYSLVVNGKHSAKPLLVSKEMLLLGRDGLALPRAFAGRAALQKGEVDGHGDSG